MGLLPRGIGEAQWPRPDEGEGDHPSIETRRGIETRKVINACRVLLGKETEKETIFARTWRIETRKQRSLVALPRRSKTALISRSVPNAVLDLSEPGRVACNGGGPGQSIRYGPALRPGARRPRAGGATDPKVPPSASPQLSRNAGPGSICVI